MCLMLMKHGVYSFIANDKLSAIFMRCIMMRVDSLYKPAYLLIFFSSFIYVEQ